MSDQISLFDQETFYSLYVEPVEMLPSTLEWCGFAAEAQARDFGRCKLWMIAYAIKTANFEDVNGRARELLARLSEWMGNLCEELLGSPNNRRVQPQESVARLAVEYLNNLIEQRSADGIKDAILHLSFKVREQMAADFGSCERLLGRVDRAQLSEPTTSLIALYLQISTHQPNPNAHDLKLQLILELFNRAILPFLVRKFSRLPARESLLHENNIGKGAFDPTKRHKALTHSHRVLN